MYCNCKKKSKMRLNEHGKKGCEKVMDDHGNQLTLKLYPPLRNTTKGNILAKGGNVLEYKMKLEASSKPKHSRPIVTGIVPLVQQKRKNKKNPILESFDDDVSQATKHGLACKKHLTRPGGQQDLDHIKKTTRNLQLQFSPKSNLGQLKSVGRSKQCKSLKHEGEMQSECIQEEVHTPLSPTHMLRGMLGNRRKKLEFEKVYCENVT